MIPWDYDATQYSKGGAFSIAPEGEHQVKIVDVDYKTTSTNKDMYVLKCKLVNSPGSVFYNLVFLPDKPEVTNQNLGAIYDSFGIREGEMDANKWINKIGAVMVEHESYSDRKGLEKERAIVKYFLTQERQVELGFITPREVEEGELDLDGEEMPF
jgi:hypothetical protein